MGCASELTGWLRMDPKYEWEFRVGGVESWEKSMPKGGGG